MSNIIIYTRAYNAEKTLCRAVDSILKQTHTDFTYYLLDNAATDGTCEIIKQYANQDRRIIPLHNEKNGNGNGILDVLKNYNGEYYFCSLDSDDEYYQNFLEKMLSFMEENSLDIGACGNDFIDSESGKYLASRKLESNLILENEAFGESFPKYHQFMRAIWGKIYHLNVLHNCDLKFKKGVSYGTDTIFAMEAFRNANRVGILSESLHKYYVSPKSISYQFDNNRIKSDQIIFDATCDYLISKTGQISDKNMEFLYCVYLNAITDTLNVLLKTNISTVDRIKDFISIFDNSKTQSLIKWQGLQSEKSEIFNQVATWVLAQNEVHRDQGLELAADILSEINIYPTKIEGWQNGETFLLLAKIRERLIKRGDPTNIDAKISVISKTTPYLSGMDVGFLVCYRSIVFDILNNNEISALNQLEELIAQGADIPDNYIEDFLKLALNLAAKLECHDYFIYFKKMQISLLIDLSRIDEAINEFADWDRILPDDLDFKELKKRLEG